MKLKVAGWSVTRKKIRSSFSLGALGMLFSVSDRVSGPRLSDQDRIDTAYPYRLELTAPALKGEYRLDLSQTGARAWAEQLSGRVWRAETGRGGPRLATDLTEYERVLWEEAAAQPGLTLTFEPAGE